jgi:hypothetical protein
MLAGQHVTPSRSTIGTAVASAAEATEIHTRILRLALGIEDSRRYWEHFDPSIPVADRPRVAFEGRWFGAKSMERVRYLLTSFQARYDAFPNALPALARWRSMDVASRQVICHWHAQLSDPLYRRFSDQFLNQRRALPTPRVDRDAVLRWLRTEYPDRWSEATLIQFASKLLSAALEAGLVGKRDPRTLHFPKVSDRALAYLLYLLRGTRFDGTMTANPYLRSVGLDEDLLLSRARSLPGLRIRSMMHLVEIDWTYPDLAAWAREVLS